MKLEALQAYNGARTSFPSLYNNGVLNLTKNAVGLWGIRRPVIEMRANVFLGKDETRIQINLVFDPKGKTKIGYNSKNCFALNLGNVFKQLDIPKQRLIFSDIRVEDKTTLILICSNYARG